MIFDKQRWPVLWGLQENKGFYDLCLEKAIINPYDFMQNFNVFQVFLEHHYLNMRKCSNIYVSENVVKMVDYDKKIFPILEKEARNPDYWPEFHGTVSYISSDPTGKQKAKNTVLLDILPRMEEYDNRKFFMISQFVENVFVGFIVGEDFGEQMEAKMFLAKDINDPVIPGLRNSFMFCKQLFFFLDHCDEKTNYILNKETRRVKTKTGDKYLNSIGLRNMKIIDSSYFTTTVRSGGFAVSGHWRMQAYG